jgi:hypothetical protein
MSKQMAEGRSTSNEETTWKLEDLMLFIRGHFDLDDIVPRYVSMSLWNKKETQTYGRASRSSAIVAFPLRQRKEVTSGDKDYRSGGHGG